MIPHISISALRFLIFSGLALFVASCAPEPYSTELTPEQMLQATPPDKLMLQDSDGDGMSDYDEMINYGTNPLWVDTDGDGLVDGGEVETYSTNPLNSDSDEDGISDGDEVLVYNSDPTNPDSDGDGILDGEDDTPAGGSADTLAVAPADSIGEMSGTDADSLAAVGDLVEMDSLAAQEGLAWTHGDSLTQMTADLVDGIPADSVFGTAQNEPMLGLDEDLYEFSERLRAGEFDQLAEGDAAEDDALEGDSAAVIDSMDVISDDILAEATVDSVLEDSSFDDALLIGDVLIDSIRPDPEEPSGPSLYEMFPPDEARRKVLYYGRSRDRSSEKKVVLFFGNSITAGFGLTPDQAFPAIVGQKIDSLGLPYRVVNAGLSGETSAGGLGRVDWVLRVPVHVFVLELGGNDALRGLPPTSTFENLRGIILKVRERHPSVKILLTGMEAPPNMGPQFTDAFRKLYADLAKEMDVTFMPFILEDVGGIPELNLPDGIHPTRQGHKIIAENLWPYLLPLLEE